MATIFLLMLFLAVAFAIGASIIDQGGVRNHTRANGSKVMHCTYREDMD